MSTMVTGEWPKTAKLKMAQNVRNSAEHVPNPIFSGESLDECAEVWAQSND